LISNLMQDTYFYLLPLVLSLGAFILVICNFFCIRMYGTVDGLITIGFAGISVFTLMLIIIVFPLMESVHENSVAFKFNMRSITRTHKLFKRKFASLRPCKTDIGGLFFARKSTKCNYIDICFQNTANALLLYYWPSQIHVLINKWYCSNSIIVCLLHTFQLKINQFGNG